MQDITDPFNLWGIRLKLSYFHDYLNAIEEFLENEAEELEKRFDIMVQQLEQDKNFPWEHVNPEQLAAHYLEEDYERVKNMFPTILRRSFFLAIYSTFEVGLNDCCNLLNFQNKALKDMNTSDKGIKKARKYLLDAGVKFPDSNEWHEIVNYQKLRNCIAHNEGRLKGCQDGEHLKRYILRNDSFLDVIPYHEDEIVFQKGFCEKVLYTIGTFLDQLNVTLKGRKRNEDF